MVYYILRVLTNKIYNNLMTGSIIIIIFIIILRRRNTPDFEGVCIGNSYDILLKIKQIKNI